MTQSRILFTIHFLSQIWDSQILNLLFYRWCFLASVDIVYSHLSIAVGHSSLFHFPFFPVCEWEKQHVTCYTLSPPANNL